MDFTVLDSYALWVAEHINTTIFLNLPEEKRKEIFQRYLEDTQEGKRFCLICDEGIENDEETLWGHIQLEHEEKFEDIRNVDTPDMLDECYKYK